MVSPPVIQALASSVATTTVSSIGHSRLSNWRVFPPPPNWNKLLISEGNSSMAAAATGEISDPRIPIATVGNPIPVTPFTIPARTNVAAIITTRAGPNAKELVMLHFPGKEKMTDSGR